LPSEETVGIESGLSTDVSSDDLSGQEWEEEADVEDSVSTASVGTSTSRESAGHPLKHIQRDYGYVRSELTRIAAMAAIIVLGLAVVAIFR
jgi:hypothetical protein